MEDRKRISISYRGSSKNMLISQDKTPYLYFPVLEEAGIVKHGFSTRVGGVSEGIFSALNLSFTRGDKKERVEENFRRIAESIGFDYARIVCSDQTHTTNIRRITHEDTGKGIIKERDYSDIDGLITNEPGISLATFYADCVPLYFVDPVKKAIGLSHSGWKGTVGRIGMETVKAMKKEFDSEPSDILAAIGPSICMDCYEVSEDVAEAFYNVFSPVHAETFLYSKGGGKYQLDLWKANEYILQDAGILPENIIVSNICTCCNHEVLYSHRASKGKRGNLAAFLCLSE